MTNVNVEVEELIPNGGTDNKGFKLGFLDSVTKAAQNDTVTVKNAVEVKWAKMTTDADGVADPVTVSTNVITLTGATATAPSGLILYR